MKKLLLKMAVLLIGTATLLYAGDDLSLRFRIPHQREQFGSVTVQPYYEIHEKNGKVEYQFPDPQTQNCVRSLFPHFGYPPCWYLQRHTQQKIEI